MSNERFTAVIYTVKLIIGQTRLFEKDLEASCKHPVGRGIDVQSMSF